MTDVIDIKAEREARREPRKGMGYEPPPTGNWLAERLNGERFLARRKSSSDSRLSEFVILTDPKALDVCLLAENCQGRGMVDWHDTMLFSQDYKFILTLTAELKDGNGNPLLARPVAGDEEPETSDSQP